MAAPAQADVSEEVQMVKEQFTSFLTSTDVRGVRGGPGRPWTSHPAPYHTNDERLSHADAENFLQAVDQ